MATVIAAGPEGSGTHMLADILTALGLDSDQRSLPHAGAWWADRERFWDPVTGEPFAPGTRFVIITRHPDPTVASVLRRGLAPDERTARAQWSMAAAGLAIIPDAYWMLYEAVVAQPAVQMASLAGWLGVPPPEDITGWVRRP